MARFFPESQPRSPSRADQLAQMQHGDQQQQALDQDQMGQMMGYLHSLLGMGQTQAMLPGELQHQNLANHELAQHTSLEGAQGEREASMFPDQLKHLQAETTHLGDENDYLSGKLLPVNSVMQMMEMGLLPKEVGMALVNSRMPADARGAMQNYQNQQTQKHWQGLEDAASHGGIPQEQYPQIEQDFGPQNLNWLKGLSTPKTPLASTVPTQYQTPEIQRLFAKDAQYRARHGGGSPVDDNTAYQQRQYEQHIREQVDPLSAFFHDMFHPVTALEPLWKGTPQWQEDEFNKQFGSKPRPLTQDEIMQFIKPPQLK